MTTKTIAGNNQNLVEVDLNPLHPGLSGGSPTTLIIIPWNASHLLFSGFTTFSTPPHGFSPLAFQSMFMCVCVCVLCKRSWVGGLVTPHHPLPPSFGWVCHHILKWLVKYLCVWVCPWWRAKIDRFFRWVFGRKNMAELPNNFYLTQRMMVGFNRWLKKRTNSREQKQKSK
jgi:hypothetical protein